MENDATEHLRERVRSSFASGTPLSITGGGSKSFYGREIVGEPLQTTAHCGLIDYDAAELVMTARAGTRLADIEAVLCKSGQSLPFEPPHFGPGATLGGTIACGLAGPARAYGGSVKDFVLGVSVLTGDARHLHFGGRVMKNVAGYDISRTLVGSMGTLGILLDISIKVLPRPSQEKTLEFELDAASALACLSEWAQRPSCISASCWFDGRLFVRLSGSAAAIDATWVRTGGADHAGGMDLWRGVREHSHPFFTGSAPLVRVVVPACTPPIAAGGGWLMEWGGAQRWLRDETRFTAIAAAANASGGFATRFRTPDRRGEVFAPLAPTVMQIHRSLKSIFDPAAILNRGRMYADL